MQGLDLRLADLVRKKSINFRWVSNNDIMKSKRDNTPFDSRCSDIPLRSRMDYNPIHEGRNEGDLDYR